MASDAEPKLVVVPKTAAEIQRFKLEKLMKKVDKDVYIPEAKEAKLPRVFNPNEFIRNVWGSSAGAGSGDFHVYRGVRRREYARQKFLNAVSEMDAKDKEFMDKMEKNKKAADEKTAKKRAKRLKKKKQQKGNKKQKVTKETEQPSEEESEDEEEARDMDQSTQDPRASSCDPEAHLADPEQLQTESKNQNQNQQIQDDNREDKVQADTENSEEKG